jgi:hypothetical protein
VDAPALAIALLPVALWLSAFVAAAVLHVRGAVRASRLTALVAVAAWLPMLAAALFLVVLGALGLGSREPADAVSWRLMLAWASIAASLVAAPLAWVVAVATIRSRSAA